MYGRKCVGERTTGVERRARILDAALELFAEQGFILTSLPMIAERVGITHAGTLHHFGSIGGVLCWSVRVPCRTSALKQSAFMCHFLRESVCLISPHLQPCHTGRHDENELGFSPPPLLTALFLALWRR